MAINNIEDELVEGFLVELQAVEATGYCSFSELALSLKVRLEAKTLNHSIPIVGSSQNYLSERLIKSEIKL